MVPKGTPKDIIHDSFNVEALGALKTKKQVPLKQCQDRLRGFSVIALAWLAYLASSTQEANRIECHTTPSQLHHPIYVPHDI